MAALGLQGTDRVSGCGTRVHLPRGKWNLPPARDPTGVPSLARQILFVFVLNFKLFILY